MQLITHNDCLLVKKNIDNINIDVKKTIMDIFNPKLEDRKKIFNIIKTYIKDNERKIYGGYALNELIKKKNFKIYEDFELPDIDFYSYDPNTDIINICNEIYDNGFTKVSGREAKHKNTYSIYVNYELYCDITYVPKYIYDKIPTKIINNLKYINPDFMIIDYLKILTDPICSNWRIEKTLNRLQILNEYYPLNFISESININQTDVDEFIKNSINDIIDYVKNKDDLIIIGFYAYNYFLLTSLYEKLNLINIPFIEFITKNYSNDIYNILKLLKNNYTDLDITYKEYYSFFTYTGYVCEIYIEDELILIVYDYNEKCIPYQTVNYINFDEAITYEKNKINIGTFSLTLLYGYINIFRHKVFHYIEMKEIYEKFVSHLVKMKNYYFQNNNFNLLDNNIFKDFITKCIYPDYNPEFENLIRYEKRKNKNKPSMYIYDPNKHRKDEKATNFFFANISGNEIKNIKHSKLNNNENYDDDVNDVNDEKVENNN